MKQKRKPHYVIMSVLVAALAAFTWSCDKDNDPSLTDLRQDKIEYLEDSLKISDSLRRINAAGIVNYAISVVNGSTSSIARADGGDLGRAKQSMSTVDGAIVTISQFGKTQTDTTDENGIVVFNGFFRSAATVSVRKTGFTSATYIAAVSIGDTTANGSMSFVGNLIPIFETVGANTATIRGRATIQTNLTNRTRETVSDGTTVFAAVDAGSGDFMDKFLTDEVVIGGDFENCECQILYVGAILHAAYSSGTVGTVTNGEYSITVPASPDGLPLVLEYSEVAANQTLYETGGALPGNRTSTYRNLFMQNATPTAIPVASSVTVAFETQTTVAGTPTAVISPTAGTLDRINVTATGDGYTGTPLIELVGGGGTGAAATATVTNGRITNIQLTSPGSGYSTAPSVVFYAGTGASATVSNLSQDGHVTSVIITNSGSNYSSATPPTVTFSAPTGTGVTAQVLATGTAVVNALGKVVGVTITNQGAAYIANPTVTIGAPGAGGVQATATATYSGQSISDVQISGAGANYSYAPRVTFSAPDISTGVRATGTAIINSTTRQVTGISIDNPGMGYLNPPSVTLSAFTAPASAEVFLTGGSVVSVDINSQGSGYTAPPAVTFIGGGGQGATGTAVMSDGKLVGINITNGGVGYTAPPTVNLTMGNGATGYATVTDGGIAAVTITDGGRNYTGAPRIVFTSSVGGGATATVGAPVNGSVSSVTMVTPGSGYLEGNTPGTAEAFSAIKGNALITKPGLNYINDVHYGTGVRQPN